MYSGRLIKVLIIILIPFNALLSQEFREFSSIHEKIDTSLNKFLEDNGFRKVTHYFDNINHIDGKWELYPYVNISNELTAVHVINKIPNHDYWYFYVLIINKNTLSILDTLGPFEKTFVNAIRVKLKNDEILELSVRCHNRIEFSDEAAFTIIDYKRKNGKLILMKWCDIYEED
jgi:hypothetical protein